MHAVDGVSLNLTQGQVLSIIGPSGCGKSTLAKMIMGFIKPDEGSISVEGVIIQGKPNIRVQMVFQDPYQSLDPLWTIEKILLEALEAEASLTFASKQQKITEVLESVGLGKDILNRKPHAFSGGQRQRIAIARALLASPRVLILDEATSALDVLVAKQLMDLLIRLKAKYNLTYVFISHNLRLVRSFSDTIAIMDTGRVIEYGSPREIFESPQKPQTRRLMHAALHYTDL